MQGEVIIGSLFALIMSIGAVLFVLLVTRQLWCWFLRINEMVAIQEKQLAVLKRIAMQAGVKAEDIEAEFSFEEASRPQTLRQGSQSLGRK